MEKKPARRDRARRVFGVGLAAFGMVLATAAGAAAHTPIMLDRSDVLPWTSPLILDGTDPVALLGTLPHCASIRSAQFDMKAGQPLTLAYGVPDEAPENALPASKMPDVLLIAPDGTPTLLTAKLAQPVPLDNGVTLLIVDFYGAVAQQGTYSLLVVGGCSPERFVVALGQDPGDFDGVLRGKVATLNQVLQWYNTAPRSRS